MSTSEDSARGRLGALSGAQAELLQLLSERKSREARRIRPRVRQTPLPERLPASWTQQRLWFIDQLEGGSAGYRITINARLRGVLKAECLQRALDAIVARHEVLRTVFVSEDGQPLQQVMPATAFLLRTVDLRSASPEQSASELLRQKQSEQFEQFDLSSGPLVRGRLIRLSDEEHVLLITMHHIISDGWSKRVFVHDLGELYAAFSEGRDPRLAPLSVQYADYAAWQLQSLSDAESEQQLRYWIKQLEGAPPSLELPTDRPRPPRPGYRGNDIRFAFDEALTREIQAFARRHDLTLFMVMYAAWAVLLARLSGQNDVLIGTPHANRPSAEVEQLIGFFANTLVLRVQVLPEEPVLDFVRRIRSTTLAAYEHQSTPFEKLVEALQPERSPDRNPLFQVMIALQNAGTEFLVLPGLASSDEDDAYASAPLDLSLILGSVGGRLEGRINYATELFSAETIGRWIGSFQLLVGALVRQPRLRLGELPVVPEAQRRELLEVFGAAPAAPLGPELIHERVAGQATASPDAIAVRFGDEALTYGELDRRAGLLAARLVAAGVGADERVAVCLERSTGLIVALLGVLKAGGAYVPLDVSYPDDRIAYMVEDCRPRVVISRQALFARLPKHDFRVILIDGPDEAASAAVCADRSPIAAENLAYVIYTSGSTGRPKGVMVTHGNLMHLAEWHCRAFDVRGGSACSVLAAFGFDASVWEIWPALCVGATLELAPPQTTGDPQALLSWWVNRPLHVSFLPTPLAELAFAGGLQHPTLRTLLVGGDRLRSRPESAPFTLVNNYGPTEITVVATSGCLSPEDPLLHIGRPVSNARIYILDERQQPVPVGVCGEIYIGGTGVSRGYLNRPDLTAERFVADPFSTSPGARMYRSGDLARWRADGSIEFIGRNDDQVKLRGFRIELHEIEAQLLTHPHVKDAAVVVKADESGATQLLAYFVRHPGAADSGDAETLRVYLKGRLPEYMVPAAFVALTQLPLTVNGKLDRRALPETAADAFASGEYMAPQGELETAIAALWCELLKVPRVGREDDFFCIGGHSLLAMQMVARLKSALGLDASIRPVFENPTLRGLAAKLQEQRNAALLEKLSRHGDLSGELLASVESLSEEAVQKMLQGMTGTSGNE